VDTCDVVIAGGGPAGSTCAWALGRAGLDVTIVDRATVHYGRAVSYGIRRCEFDDYLLHRSGARLALGARVDSIARDGSNWIVNDSIRAPMLVGAGGHFCPVARLLNRGRSDADGALVVAQEAEYATTSDEAACAARAEVPELYFCRDFSGYGWYLRKGAYVNVGIGRLDRHGLPLAATHFIGFLEAARRLDVARSRPWPGHAYVVWSGARRRAVDAGVLLVGDAAGLADPQSGEGIRPAVLSGLAAAKTILAAAGRYTGERLDPYNAWLRDTFGGARTMARAAGHFIAPAVWLPVARRLITSPAFVRHVVLDRGFLRG
jgi:flavin-dependent dehydrogenase